MSSWSRNNPKSGKYERYYRCNLKNRASNRCSSTMLNADVAEDLVLKNIKGVTVDKLIESYDKILSEQKSKGSLIKKEELKLKTQIENNKKIIESLIRKLALLDDDPVIVSAFQKEFNNLNIQNISLKKRFTRLKESYLKSRFQIKLH